MPIFTFIHAADLHLGAPFRGLGLVESGAVPAAVPGGRGSVNLLAEAGFEALARLEAACLETGADFLILSGDIYDDKDGVLRARFALRDMFLRLREDGIRVFVAHGNHDPLRPGPLPVAWPDNVTVFGETVSCHCVSRDGVPLALVHGLSHARAQETGNLSLQFARYAPQTPDERFAALPADLPGDIFQVAVLHCAVGGTGEGHAPYSPCSLQDLTGAGFDYWALGHVHQGRILCDAPFVVYPGSLQGLHINETGPHGCVVVRAGDGTCSVENLPLAPVVWQKLRLLLGMGTDDPDTVDVLEERILAALDEAAGDAAGVLFCRVILEGATDLDAVLRRPGSVHTLLDRLRGELGSGAEQSRVWVKDIQVATSPVLDFAAMAERDDLVGEVVRMADAVRKDPDRAGELVAKAVSALHGNARVKKSLAGTAGSGDTEDGPDGLSGPGEPGRLVDEAKALLCSLLEGRE